MEEEKKWACERLNLKEIPDCPDYFCDKNGEIYSYKSKEMLKMKSRTNRLGYRQILLFVGDKYLTRTVHRLILKAFCPNFFDHCMDCNHKNGIRDDNRLENLEWMTKTQNEQHAWKVLGKNMRGEKHTLAKVTNKQIKEIQDLRAQGLTYISIAKMYSIGISSVCRIVKRDLSKYE